MSIKKTILLIASLLSVLSSKGQDVSAHSFAEGELSVKMETMAFFRDNEFNGDIQKGYTLPGAWIRPAIAYNPLDNVHLEAGASALFFSGANKYPCWAYHDIAKWKGNQYQDGIHVLPWLRAEMKTGSFDIVLGNIYGGTYHGLSTPLYNKEQILSADPEMGAQIIYDTRKFHLDTYCNWQSFQFREDTHQEAFTVGIVAKYRPFNTDGWKNLQLNSVILAQHRGGELDITDHGVQTLGNGSIGLSWEDTYIGTVNRLRFEADAMGCYQQKGTLWHFDSGAAYNASVTIGFLRDLHTQIGYFHAPGNFVSLYGSPFFSTVSLIHSDVKYKGLKTAYLDFGYSHTFGKAYTLGANIEAYSVHPSGGKSDTSFSFGLYMHLNPEILIKKFK